MNLADIAMAGPPEPVTRSACIASRAGRLAHGERFIPEETAVAFTYNGHSHAVMMATPSDLEDFALGLSLTEGIVGSPVDISELDVLHGEFGAEVRMWIVEGRMAPYAARRRAMVGPTGCGLRGIESLIEAARPARPVGGPLQVTPQGIAAAVEELSEKQVLNRQSRALHAAAFWQPHRGIVEVREDVVRHNALDKLVGALALRATEGASGIVVMTSRVSVELVQKTAALGAPILVAVSAPTALAVRAAEACGMTLVGIARERDFEVFTHTHRIRPQASRN
jgi:FdhD protein